MWQWLESYIVPVTLLLQLYILQAQSLDKKIIHIPRAKHIDGFHGE